MQLIDAVSCKIDVIFIIQSYINGEISRDEYLNEMDMLDGYYDGVAAVLDPENLLEAVKANLAEWFQVLYQKGENILHVVTELDARADAANAFSESYKQMYENYKKIAARHERKKAYLKDFLLMAIVDRFGKPSPTDSDPDGKIAIINETKVRIMHSKSYDTNEPDIDKLPLDMIRIKKELDKEKMKKLFAAGQFTDLIVQRVKAYVRIFG